MAENECTPEYDCRDYFKEAVCIDAMRIYDSCSDKDCLEDIRVLFPAARQPLIDSATNVRIKDVSVISVYIDLQPIPFNKGFYSVDMTFFFDVALDLFGGPTSCPVPVNGVSIFNKKVILYGSEGNVKMYSSGHCIEDIDTPDDCKVLPKATVQVGEHNLGVSILTAEAAAKVQPENGVSACLDQVEGLAWGRGSASKKHWRGSSTIRVQTRSARARLWVTISRPSCRSRTSRSISSQICAWVITSSMALISSASRKRVPSKRERATQNRWSSPPESSLG